MSEQDSFFSGPPQTMFVFGLVAGIAVSAILGLLFFSGSPSQAPQVDKTDTETIVEGPTFQPIPIVTEDDWIKGDLSKAKVVLVEYSDFQCPYCGRHYEQTMKQFPGEYGDDVAVVFRHFPLSFHAEAVPSALAAECVGAQKGDAAFFVFKDAMFTNQDSLGTELYETTAESLGVNMETYRDCVENQTYVSEVSKDQVGGAAAGVEGTPATFVNGELVSGAMPYAQFKAAIDSILAN
jgi:protein-disulfide isomerase